MFKVSNVKSCPVTKESRGVITMTATQIAMIAGAVRDKIEWIVLLGGERSADGYEVKISKIVVPKQRRDAAHADLEEIDLPEDIVGVMHSHHTMGAWFSKTDDEDLNPRFATSIVVAIAENNLGFSYKATGKVQLPCGATGVIDFVLSVAGTVDRFIREPIRGL